MLFSAASPPSLPLLHGGFGGGRRPVCFIIYVEAELFILCFQVLEYMSAGLCLCERLTLFFVRMLAPRKERGERMSRGGEGG